MAMVDSGTNGNLKKVGRVGRIELGKWELHDDGTLILLSTNEDDIQIKDKKQGKSGNNIFGESKASWYITSGTIISLLISDSDRATGNKDVIIPKETECDMKCYKDDSSEDERVKGKKIWHIKLNIPKAWIKPHNSARAASMK